MSFYFALLLVFGWIAAVSLYAGVSLLGAWLDDRRRNMYAPPADVAEWRAVHHRGGQR